MNISHQDMRLASISNSEGKISSHITIAEFEKFCAQKEQNKIAEMVYHRLNGRYIKPFQYSAHDYHNEYQNGFAIMASACLLIETLVSFQLGREETEPKQGKETFESFFDQNPAFSLLKNQNFYKCVRCGILHQGETTGGFRITREDCSPIFDPISKRINAVKFSSELQKSLTKYRQDLESTPWDSEFWDNLRRKMRFIIKNCR